MFQPGDDLRLGRPGNLVQQVNALEQAVNFLRIAGRDTVTAESTLRRQVLDQLIGNELLQAQALKDTIDVTREEVQSKTGVQLQ